MIDIIVNIYLDDIFNYSDNISKHTLHIREVLCRLRTNGLFACVDKCEFHVTSCEYLDIYCHWRPHHGPVQSPDHSRLAHTTKSQGYSIFPRFANFYHHFIYGYSKITVPLMHLTHRYPLAFIWWVPICLEALKRLSPQLQSLSIGSQTLKSQSRLMPLTMHSLLSFQLWLLLATCTLLHSTPGILLPWNSITMSITKSYSQFLKLSNDATLPRRLWTSDRCGRWSLEFAILFNDQNSHTSTSMLVQIPFQIQPCIHFCAGKLGTKPMHSLGNGHHLKEGNSKYASINPQKYCQVFTSKQLALSPPSYHPINPSPPWISHHGCWKAPFRHLVSTPRGSISAEHLNNQSDPQWTLDPDGYCATSDASMFQTPAISYYMFSSTTWPSHCRSFWSEKDPPSSPHQYYWSGLPVYVKTTANNAPLVPMPNLCTTNPMDFSSNFQFQEPWNSISMDFIEKLPPYCQDIQGCVNLHIYSTSGSSSLISFLQHMSLASHVWSWVIYPLSGLF